MKGLHKGCIRKVDNPMKWMEEDKSHFEIKKELQKFLSENDYILNLVGAENESALLLVAEHFANWNGMQHAKEELTGGERLERLQPSLPSDLDEAAEEQWAAMEYASNTARESTSVRDWCTDDIVNAFKAGVKFQAEQGYNREAKVKEDAGGYPYIDEIELYDYDNDKPLAKKGDKVRIQITKL